MKSTTLRRSNITREKVAMYFGLQEPNVVFTKNSTEAINLFFRGFLKKGDHVVVSPYEHNAVLRPLQALREKNVIEYTVVSPEDLGLSGDAFANKYFNENTVLLAMTLASNLTGRIVFSKETVFPWLSVILLFVLFLSSFKSEAVL